MEKYDIKKELKHSAFAQPQTPCIIEIPPMSYLAFDGHGNPNTSPLFDLATGALYPLAYGIKFMAKARNQDFVVGPLEGLWWHHDHEVFLSGNKDLWQWTLLLPLPPFIAEADCEKAREQVAKKKNPSGLDRVYFCSMDEGLCVQQLYRGSYDNEHGTIAAMHQWAADHGYGLRAKHHEIYLSDPRRTEPEKLKTIIRQPLEKL